MSEFSAEDALLTYMLPS